jgi:hypothetical protein
MLFVKNNFLSLIILVLIGVLFFQRCGQKKDTTVVAKADTSKPVVVYVTQPAQQVPAYQPQPIVITSPNQPGSPIVIPPQYQNTSNDIKELTQQVKDLAAQFYATKVYRDSIQLRDSAGNRVGVFHNYDSVGQNSILKRSPSYQLSFPHTYQTVTIKEPYKPVNQLYIGGGISGNQTSFVQAFEAGLMLKNRKDQLYGVKAGISTSGSVVYGLQSYWKIKLHK